METINNVALLIERLNKDVTDIEAALSLGNLYYDQKNAGLAVLYYRLVLDINPALPGVWTDLGTMYWQNGNISLAEQSFREAIERDAGFGHAYVNLGLLLQHAKNKVTDAREVWQQLLAFNSEHPVAGKARELLQQTAAQVH